ncbi:MAG: class I SAM-dependent methyltransferase [Desulfobulbaceae bacterium]|nr:class I SAM-dependent methyltransferase [Desulfobulbaceae bacterium]
MTSTARDKAVTLFDEAAATWDKPIRVELAKGVAKVILDRLPLDQNITAMEFGCGTGLITALLAPHLKSIVAIDNSAGMLEELEKKIKLLQIDNITSQVLDLTNELPLQSFQLVFSSMTMHHVKDIDKLMRDIHAILEPGGYIALADLEREDGTFHSDHEGVAHLGLEKNDLLNFATNAGFTDLNVETAHIIRKEGNDGKEHEYPVLLLTGKKK